MIQKGGFHTRKFTRTPPTHGHPVTLGLANDLVESNQVQIKTEGHGGYKLIQFDFRLLLIFVGYCYLITYFCIAADAMSRWSPSGVMKFKVTMHACVRRG